MTFSTINATLCTGSAARAQHTRSSINVRQKAYILHQRRLGGLFLQLPHSRVRAATGVDVCKIWSWCDEPHSTSSRCTGLSPDVVTLFEDSLLTSCENKLGILWLDVPVPELFTGCFRTMPPSLCCEFSYLFLRRRTNRNGMNVGLCGTVFAFSAEGGSLLDRNDKSFYCQSLNGRRQIGICLNVFNEVEFTNQ